MKVTDALLGEHAVFYELFDRVESIVDATANVDVVLTAVRVLAAAVASHARVEESLLFSESADAASVTLMLSEHRDVERLVKRISEATEPVSARNGAHILLRMLREHFHREEHLLIRPTDSELGEQKLHELGALWAERRGLV